jgi:ketosteroid isomerase-like protein
VGADENLATVTAAYEAFGRGDVETVLELLTDEVDWATETTSTAAPWYGVRSGKDEVAAFFESFGSTMEVEEFSPYAFGANDDEVFSVVRFVCTPRTTGRTVEMDLHHYFRFEDGLIAFYRGTEDTAQVEAALYE